MLGVRTYNVFLRDPRSRACVITVRDPNRTMRSGGFELELAPKRHRITLRHGGWWSDNKVDGRATFTWLTIVKSDEAWVMRAESELYFDVPVALRRRHYYPGAAYVPGFDWDELLAFGRAVSAGADPVPLLDWFRDRLPEPWSHLGEEPRKFFAAVCPFPLMED